MKEELTDPVNTNDDSSITLLPSEMTVLPEGSFT